MVDTLCKHSDLTFYRSCIVFFCPEGFKDISLEKAQELRDHGVSVSFIKKMKQKGFNNLTLADYMKLRDGGWD